MNLVHARRLATALAATVALLFAGAAAWGTAASGPARSAGLTRADHDFLRRAAESGLAEVQGSRLAMQKGVNTQVKGFAQQMIDDHTKSNDALKQLAQGKGIALPTEPSGAQRARLAQLAAADGGGFDRRYADTLGVDAHRDSLRLFQKAAAGAQDPDIRAFAAKTLPNLQHHLEMAHELKKVAQREGNVRKPGDRKQ